jgi:hypothetical protein
VTGGALLLGVVILRLVTGQAQSAGGDQPGDSGWGVAGAAGLVRLDRQSVSRYNLVVRMAGSAGPVPLMMLDVTTGARYH